MDSQLTAEAAALRLFFTEDIYLIDEPDVQQDTPVRIAVKEEVEAVADVPAGPAAVETVEFRYLGSNKRNILILVNDEHHEVSDEAGRELLRKIVKSVNLTANDFALMNYAKYRGVGFQQLKAHFSCVLVLVFGVRPADLSLETAHPEHSIVKEGEVRMIFSADLKALDQNPAGKKALWGSLQNLGL